MYSCGSLAPKLKRGGGGGCMDHQFHKPAQPWEKSEGYNRLLINHYKNIIHVNTYQTDNYTFVYSTYKTTTMP